VNASPDLYADLKIDTQNFEIVALDGMPLSFHDPQRRTESVDHVFVPPAGRVKAIVTGPEDGVHTSLRTSCIDTGPDGDPSPAMALADLVDPPQPDTRVAPAPLNRLVPLYKPLSPTRLAGMENGLADFVVTFTEDKNGFYTNGSKFSMAAPHADGRDRSISPLARGERHE